MSSGADLFVVCKQCGSEVSPYITECPYCGHRLRRRAPKLPRELVPSRAPRRASSRLPWRRARVATPALATRRRLRARAQVGVGSAPYATIALVALGCGAWVAWHARPSLYGEMIVAGPLRGHWWKLLTSQFGYQSALYAFVSLATIGVFGWLLERRRGALLTLALFLGAGITAVLLATALYAEPVVAGGNAAALALLGAWAVPDLHAARAGYHYEGDLLGAGAVAAVLLALPFGLEPPEASWLAGVTGGTVGVLVGLGLQMFDAADS